ncbi:MAG: hypothetical protein ACJAYK_002686 [Crocinitomicaceae bacterium]|jgi:hypothetical protein
MSYLLEALKKAEEDRLSLGDTEENLLPIAHFKSNLPMGLIAVVIIVLFATIIKLFSKPPTEQLNDLDTSQISKDIVPLKASEYVLLRGETLIEPGNKLQESPAVAQQLLTVATQNEQVSVAATTKKALQLAELSPQQLNKIPSLSLESHLYSTVAQYSSVVINGQNHSEGDLLSAGVVLKSINANGIVISVDGTLVELPKGITWMSSSYAK